MKAVYGTNLEIKGRVQPEVGSQPEKANHFFAFEHG
jgi:hypothetical protein